MKIFKSYTLVCVILFIASFAGCAKSPGKSNSLGSDFDQKTFKTPQELVNNLTAALNNKDSEELLKILGPDGKNLVFSGDPVSDNLEMEYLSKRLAERSELIPYVSNEFKDVEIFKLRIGRFGTNSGIPIVNLNDGKGWKMASRYFAPRSIKKRMAMNEIEVWKACMEFVEAQKQYIKQDWDSDGVFEYAQKLFSSEGKKDGLFWSNGPSPLSEIVAKANAEGYKEEDLSGAQPYHGYLFKILTKQGPKAKGGQKDYILNGNMTEGFALIAYPMEWGASGLKTYAVGPDANIYGKNLGISTHNLVSKIDAFNPEQGWFWVQQPQVNDNEEYLEEIN